MRKVFVTGGSGFVGSHLLRRLRQENIEAVALARSASTSEQIAASGARVVVGDLGEPASLRESMAGCDTVFHLGAYLPDWDYDKAYRVNVDGTRALLDGARQAGVRRVVYVSGTGVMVGHGPLRNVDEDMPRGPPVGVLSATRILSEALAISASSADFETVVVRFPYVWGQGDTLRPVLVRLVRSGKFRWIGGGRHLVSICHVRNAVSGLLLAATQGRLGSIYWIADDDVMPFRDFVMAQLAVDQLTPPESSIPRSLALALAAVLPTLSRWGGVRRPPLLTPTVARFLGQEITVDTSRARRDLGYRPLVSWEQGLAALEPLPAARERAAAPAT
jgi:nucleoside-diphosphate-sugar epimerase